MLTVKQATAAVFHTAMTIFGDQPSVVIATAGGSLVKCNSDAWMAAAAVAAAANGDGEGDVTAGVGEKRFFHAHVFGRFEVDVGCSFSSVYH